MNGWTVLTTFCVTASRTSTVRSLFTTGNPRMLIVRLLTGCLLLVPERELNFPEKGDVLARLQRDRFKHHLVVEIVPGEQARLAHLVQRHARNEERIHRNPDEAGWGGVDGECAGSDRAAQGRDCKGRVGLRERDRVRGGLFGSEAELDAIDGLGRLAREQLDRKSVV